MGSVVRDVRGEVPWLLPMGLITFMTLVLAVALGVAHATNPWPIIAEYGQRVVLITPLVGGAVLVALTLICLLRGERPVPAISARIRERFASAGAFVSVASAILMIPVLMGSFGLLKMLLPLSRPFSWDDRFAVADRILFLGIDPWRVTHSLFGSPFFTHLLDFTYTLWVPLVVVGVLVASCADPLLRARYFLSFAAGWLLIGVGGAYALSSAGPCFAVALGTAEAGAFRPLMDRLTEMNGVAGLGAVQWQQELWKTYQAGDYGFAKGISAMPSMHNAIATLYILALARGPRPFRVASWAFAAIIYVGSIHLGWHYAVDGIVGGVAMWVVWLGAGLWLDKVGYCGVGDAEALPLEPEAAPALV